MRLHISVYFWVINQSTCRVWGHWICCIHYCLHKTLHSGSSEEVWLELSLSNYGKQMPIVHFHINSRHWALSNNMYSLQGTVPVMLILYWLFCGYFPQQVLLCTSTVHDQSADIIHGYLRILWIWNTKPSIID